MTIQELRNIVNTIEPLGNDLGNATNELRILVAKVKNIIAEDNIALGMINADQLVAIYTPLYLAALHKVEVAADALGTDTA